LIDKVDQDVPPEKITDKTMLGEILSMKIKDFPKHVPAYLDLIVEKNPKLLDMPGISSVLADKVQDLLNVVGKDSSLSGNREWMDSLRKSLQKIVIPDTLYKELEQFGKMDDAMREKLKAQLGIEGITESLDQNTRDIIRKVHTGFYQFDAEMNGWVNSVGALVFLWPENIAGIKKYLEKYNPQHPFLESIRTGNFHGNDKTGKYAFEFTGNIHNMSLAESEYLRHYIELRAKNPKKTHEEIVADLKKEHAVTTGSQKAVEEFEKKYNGGSVSSTVEELKTYSDKISDTFLPSKIPQNQEFSRLINEAKDGDQY